MVNKQALVLKFASVTSAAVQLKFQHWIGDGSLSAFGGMVVQLFALNLLTRRVFWPVHILDMSGYVTICSV